MDLKSVSLAAPAGFSLQATVLSHGWHECSPMSWSQGGRCFQLLERERDQPFRLSVTQDAPSRATRRPLRITIETTARDRAASIDDVGDRLLGRLSVALGLDRDLAEFYELCAGHSALRDVPRLGAGRMIRSASMTENIVKAICGTNVNWTQAVKMINRIGQLGPSLPHFRNQNAWPTPLEILRAGEVYLRDVCRLGYRTGAILGFCRDVADGKFDPEGLDVLAADPNVPTDELVRRLRTVPGIGTSSANYLVGFLGRHDRLSIDSATFAHVAAVHTNGRKPTVRRIERIYAPYGRWKGLVCWLEHWLRWGTARQMLAELNGSPVPAARNASVRASRRRPRTA